MFMCGGRIAFFGGDIKRLVNDIQVVRPTIFVSVPRLLNRIYDKVSERGERERIERERGEGAFVVEDINELCCQARSEWFTN